jgi:GNAT superfamily N-acetyltransferase
MQREDLLTLYDREMRIAAPPPGAGFRREQAGPILRFVGPSPAVQDNYVLYSRLAADTADAAIRGEIGFFRSIGHGFEWKLHGHDTPADLAARLERHGLTPAPPETIMVCDLEETALRPPTPPPAEVRRLARAEELADLVAVQDAVWEEDHAWFGTQLADELAADPSQIEILVAYDGGRPVATSVLRVHGGTHFASVWAAATLPPFRRRGLYTTLVERHARTASAAGARLLIADANAASRPVLERVGFRPLVAVQGFVWEGASR